MFYSCQVFFEVKIFVYTVKKSIEKKFTDPTPALTNLPPRGI